ncbi:hypothetical protein [Streptomyces nitrosporeus]|uniref:hypothetical protein n=1 Tax=Streptomyces nitrosporeus TaxID=28894 RepID=UPI00399F13DB
MPAVKAEFKVNSKNWARFEGHLEPDGASAYRFKGTLTAITMLDRSSAGFPNKVRLGHGGTKSEYERMEFEIEGVERENTFKVEGRGTRKPNDTVDFYVGLNEGLSGQFKDGTEVTLSAGGPSQSVTPIYQKFDSYNVMTYDVRFDGSARADGENGFCLTGTIDATQPPSVVVANKASVGYKTDSGSWEYKTFAFKDLPQEIKVIGTRKPGDKLAVQLGATTGLGNAWQYGDTQTVKLPNTF